jgi:nitrogenase molybdenum-iron protein alpha chain
MDMTLNNPCWKNLQAPWKKDAAEEDEKVAVGA